MKIMKIENMFFYYCEYCAKMIVHKTELKECTSCSSDKIQEYILVSKDDITVQES